MMKPAKNPNTRGLSVIEALVAIAIMGMAFSGLMSWRQSILHQQQRIETIERANRDRNNAMALLADVNPMEANAGAIAISADEKVSWRSTPLTDLSRSTAYPSGDGAFMVALYRIDASIEGADARSSRFSFERLGWRALDERGGEIGSPQ